VSVPVELPTQAPLTTDALVARVNGLVGVERIQATVSLRFRDLRQAAEGKNKEYPAADGILILSRPESIRLRIKAPFVGKRLADMVSDGTKFRLALYYPENKRRFVYGSNAGRYKRIEANTQTDNPELQRAGALANIRPQHLTDAFLLKPLTLDIPNGVFFLDETRRIESDDRPGAKKTQQVVRHYYTLTMLERTGDGPEARVVRRLWFDRTRSGTPLVRQEVYENGELATDIRYEDYAPSSSGTIWPQRVTIERVQDGYSVDVIFEPNALTINGELPEEVFNLKNEDNLEEVDLDKRADVLQPGGAAR
jgi:hypothetical protein